VARTAYIASDFIVTRFRSIFDSFSIIFIHLSATSGTPGSVEPLGSVEPWLITPEVTESEFEAMGYCFIFTV